tara:strand:+ start:294 stop:503 length:210 start_codon:yes stop_codon:yes gene_type:complete
MKLALNLFLFLFALVMLGERAISLTDYKIKKFCKKEKLELTCIKKLQKKRSDLQKGYLIEIPVTPYKSN